MTNNISQSLTLKDIKETNSELYYNLLSLAKAKIIWIGRNGYGFCSSYRREQRKEGYPRIINDFDDRRDLQNILYNLYDEGSIFASYSTLINYTMHEKILEIKKEKEKIE